MRDAVCMRYGVSLRDIIDEINKIEHDAHNRSYAIKLESPTRWTELLRDKDRFPELQSDMLVRNKDVYAVFSIDADESDTYVVYEFEDVTAAPRGMSPPTPEGWTEDGTFETIDNMSEGEALQLLDRAQQIAITHSRQSIQSEPQALDIEEMSGDQARAELKRLRLLK